MSLKITDDGYFGIPRIRISQTSNADMNIGLQKQQTNMKELIEIRFDGNSVTKSLVGFGEVPKSDFSLPEEVIKVNAVFFKKPYHKQRAVLRLVIWWAVKRYFKILFK